MNITIRTCFACCFWLTLATAPRATELSLVALTGSQAPGMPNGVKYSSLYLPMLNSAGQFAFIAEFTGNGVNSSNDSGLFLGKRDAIALVAREGEHAPGTPDGVRYSNFEGSNRFLAWNLRDQFAFPAGLSGPGVTDKNNRGIWFNENNTLSLVTRTGFGAPGLTGDVRFIALDGPLMDSAGNLAFTAVASEGGVLQEPYTRGIWGGNPNALTLVAHEGGQAPGLPSDYKFSAFYYDSLEFGIGGHIGLTADISGPDVTGFNREGVWSGASGSLQFLTRSGTPAPETEAGTSYAFFAAHTINALGQTTFTAHVIGPNVNATNQWGLWSDASGSLQLIARSGDYAPGTSEGVYFKDDFTPHTNAAGRVMFWNTLAGPGVYNSGEDINYLGIWSNAFGPLSLVARLGDPMPGAPSGSYLEDFDGATMNELGQTAFVGWLDGLTTDRSKNTGIWAQDRSGVLHLIARAGEVLEVAPGDFRQVNVIGLGGINDLGQIAIVARFVDGSQGIFFSNLVAIPEPTLIALLLPIVSLMLSWRSERRIRSSV